MVVETRLPSHAVLTNSAYVLVEEYRIRNNACVEASRKSLQTQIQESGEKARIYNEKMQQLKAKKSTKRQRDSSGGSVSDYLKLMCGVFIWGQGLYMLVCGVSNWGQFYVYDFMLQLFEGMVYEHM